ncbi:hypothetical protein IQ255_05200 [Pleurocapsales cyanobacterium LEGE 10410]|nr:hypothetical protein [Pleurocapsales cyanobacterium LEGE 10410]
MKLQFKALSLTLGLVALLGACTSVKSGTPDITGADESVEILPNESELGASEEMETEGLEATDGMDTEGLEATDGMDTEGLEATDGMDTESLEAAEEIEEAELEAAEEIEDAENAEIETPELEAVEETELDQSSIEGTMDNGMETTEDSENVDSQI